MIWTVYMFVKDKVLVIQMQACATQYFFIGKKKEPGKLFMPMKKINFMFCSGIE
jgi:hypothetical protein